MEIKATQNISNTISYFNNGRRVEKINTLNNNKKQQNTEWKNKRKLEDIKNGRHYFDIYV